MAQEGKGKTRMTVSKPGIDTNPGRATSPKKTSHARIRHLDKTEVCLEKARVYEKEPTSTPEGEENRQPSIPRGNPPPHGRPPNASPWASETAVNPAAGTTLRRPTKGAPRSGWKNPDQNLETRRTGELPDRREEAIGD